MKIFDVNTIEELLDKPYWIVDILPEQVPAGSPGQYPAVEQYYLQKQQITALREKYLDLLLKLNCYYDLAVSCDGGDSWKENPPPKRLESWMLTETRHSALHILFAAEKAMAVLNGDDTYMTVYNAPAALLQMLQALAGAEGLFVWQPGHREED